MLALRNAVSLGRGFSLLFLGQIVSMASNFAATLVVLRRAGVVELGSFAVALSVYTVYLAVQRSLISEPLLAAQVGRGNRLIYLSSCKVTLLLAILAAYVVGLAGVATSASLIPLALALPLLGIQDHARYVSLRDEQPAIAIRMDALWFVLAMAGLVAVPDIDATRATIIWCIAGVLSLLASWPIRNRLGVRRCKTILAVHVWRRHCGKVAVATTLDNICNQLFAQAVVLSLAAFVGLNATGEYRAAQALFGPCLAAIIGLNMFTLSRAPRYIGLDFKMLTRVGGGYLAIVSTLGVCTLLVSSPLQEALFGGTAVDFGLCAATLLLFMGLALSSAVSVLLRINSVTPMALFVPRLLSVLLGLMAVTMGLKIQSVSLATALQVVAPLTFVLIVIGRRGREVTCHQALQQDREGTNARTSGP